VATYDHNVTTHEWATGYTWDIVRSGSNHTWMENEDAES
jgi:protocatechuate 3,4-dioxygenase, beta subunit